MPTKKPKNITRSTRHVAGIIPVANLKTDYDSTMPAVLYPYAAGGGYVYSFIQKAVLECALAGCRTIWIVANDDLAPIIRHTVGDYVFDPVWAFRKRTWAHSELRREVPIYYLPIHMKHKDRLDSNGWSALHGITMASWITRKISKWIVADKFYVTFPLSVYDFNEVRKHRDSIRDEKNFSLTYKGKTVKDNIPLPFTLTFKDHRNCRVNIQQSTTREYAPPADPSAIPDVRLSKEDQWSARHFDLDEVYAPLDMSDVFKAELPWFYDAREWHQYCDYLGNEGKLMRYPTKFLTRTHKHSKIAFDELEKQHEGEE